MTSGRKESEFSPVDQWVDLWSAEGSSPSLEEFVSTHPGLPKEDLLDVVLIDQRMHWQDRCGPKVDDYLKRFPVIAADARMLLDLIFGEIRAAKRLGIPVDVATMIVRFPAFGDEITKQAEFSSWIESETPTTTTDSPINFHDLRTGSTFGEYELLERIGGGGMGSIFRARHRSVHRIVALKVLNAERMASDIDRQRFQNESATVARLDHPNIVPVFEVGEVDQTPYFTTKLVSPGSLEQNSHRLSGDFDRIADTLRQISLAVHYAHQHGVLHRDLKPSNVLIDEHNVPYVADFGLARILGDACRLTLSGDLIGTPVWMPPEFADPRGRDATIASDVYGLGAILYFLITGHAPHVGRTLVETLSAIRENDPPSPRLLNHKIPVDLDLICRRALDRVPARRYETAGMLAEDLNRYLKGDSIHARPLPWWEVQRRKILRRPVRSTIALACVVLLIAVGAYTQRLQRLNSRLATLVNQAGIARREATNSQINARLAEHQAGKLRDEAQTMQLLASRAQEDYRKQLYAASMRRAWQAWQDGDLRHANALLSKYASNELSPDGVGFEWSYLKRHVNAKSTDFALKVGEARVVCLSGDGQSLAIGTNMGTVEVFSISSGERMQHIQLRYGLITKIQFNATSTYLACMDLDGMISVIDCDGGIPTGAINMTDNACQSFVFAANGDRIIAAHADGTLREWSLSGTELRNTQLSYAKVDAMAISQDGRRLAIAADITIEVRNPESHEVLTTHKFGRTSFRLTDIALSEDGTRCVVGRADGYTFLLEFGDNNRHDEVCYSTIDYPRAVDISRDGELLAACDYGGTVHVWAEGDNLEQGRSDKRDGIMGFHASAHTGRGYDVEFAADGRSIVSAGQDGIARLWQLENRSNPSIVKLPDTISGRTTPAILPNGSILVACGTGVKHAQIDTHRIEDLKTGVSLNSVAVSPDGTVYASAEQATKVIEAERVHSSHDHRQVLWRVEHLPSEQLAFSPDGERLALVNWTDDVVVILNARSGNEITRLPAAQCHFAAWSPNGRQLAFTVSDDVHVADTERWATHQILKGHSSTATSLSWSPDGSQIASASRDRSLCLWKVENGTLLHRLLGHLHWTMSSTFSQDGKTLVSADQNGVVKIWNVSTGGLIGDLWTDASRPIHSVAFTQDGNTLIGLSRIGAVITFDTRQ